MNLNDINHVVKGIFWKNRDSDGDSFWVLADQGLDSFRLFEPRMRNVWAPESNTDQGKTVKAKVQTDLESLPYLIVQTFKTKNDRDVQSFTRYIADVWLPDGTYYNSYIMKWMSDNGITDHGIGS
jgi:hypothetical protein